MKGAEVVVGRESELSLILGELEIARHRGILITGAMGIGKSCLATHAANIAQARGGHVDVVTASPVLGRIPLGAFAPLALVHDTDVGDAPNASALAAVYIDHLLARYGEGPWVLVVEDAQWLDDLSRAVLEHLSIGSEVFLVVTARAGEGDFDALLGMSERGLLRWLPLNGLADDDATKLVEGELGGEVDPGAAQSLIRRSRGNPLFLLELTRGSVAGGALVSDGGRWFLQGKLNPSERLRELVAARLRGVELEESRLLEMLAFVDQLPRALVERFSSLAILEALEDHGLVTTELVNRQLFASFAQPLYADVKRIGLSGLRTQLVTERLANYFESLPDDDDDACLKVASLRLICGGGRHERLARAARIALERHDFGLALDFAEAAIDAGGGVPARLLRARVLSQRGDYRAADTEIVGFLDLTTSDEELVEAAVLRLDFLTFYTGAVEDALTFAADVEQRVDNPEFKELLAVRRAGALLHTEGPVAVAEALTPVLAVESSEVLGLACMLGAWASLRMGRIEHAYNLTCRGEEAQSTYPSLTDWYPEIHVVGRCFILAASGRIREAEALGEEGLRKGLADESAEAVGGFSLFLTSLSRDSGNTADALRHAETAMRVYDPTGRPIFHCDALVHRALALAIAGDSVAALSALDELAESGAPAYWYFSPEVHQARGWALAARGRTQDAYAEFLESARISMRTGDLLGAVTAWHGAARIGFAKQALKPLRQLVGQIDSELAQLRLSHAAALTASDAVGLMQVADAFERCGAELLAGEAALAAAVSFDKAGEPRRAESSRRRATAIFRRQRGDVSPALGAARLADLTISEEHTARLAGGGHTNAEIAEMQGLSIRTVENRLQRVYVKLGISSRSDLAGLLYQHPS